MKITPRLANILVRAFTFDVLAVAQREQKELMDFLDSVQDGTFLWDEKGVKKFLKAWLAALETKNGKQR